jgi:hypothetical protein
MKNETTKAAFIFLSVKILLLIASLGLGSETIEYVASPNIFVYAEAKTEPVVSTEHIDENLCGLDTVVCDGEETTERALAEIPHKTETTKNLIKYLFEYAQNTDVDPEEVARTIYCESMWYNIPSGYTNSEGIQEDSHGLAQIHLPSHPDISIEQAYDPYFAIRFMVDHWHTVKWYGYDRELETCTNPIKGYWLE